MGGVGRLNKVEKSRRCKYLLLEQLVAEILVFFFESPTPSPDFQTLWKI
jgi:hypothetical protein